ncbi:hypothetical protein V202x_36760 [Gimesia aquarii]|uniref:Uncharacterized protein n=2 Tax=Gimesia aquarii TaxID=2527964 RepID=A0A517WYE7_9PLAN|nr:hypothetical protein V202x_36760 [Gimesia aquarii]
MGGVVGVCGVIILLGILYYLFVKGIPDSKVTLILLFVFNVIGLFWSKITLAYYLNHFMLRTFIYLFSIPEGFLLAALINKDNKQTKRVKFYVIAGCITVLCIMWQEFAWMPKLFALPELPRKSG